MMASTVRSGISRRRVLRLLAVGGLALGGSSAGAHNQAKRWRGTALGAPAELTFANADAAAAERAVGVCLDEIERLERELSLYRPDSALARLNQNGRLPAPSAEMLALMRFSRWLGDRSAGAFDVTVQPLWELHARHFATAAADHAGPAPAALAAALTRVDYRLVDVQPAAITLSPGLSVTLNGIAQGYITDRVSDRLRALGWRHVLVQLGELRGLDGRDPRRPWTVKTPLGQLALSDRALAVSAGAGTVFSPDGRHHHLFNPATGLSSWQYRAVAVLAPTAVLADGLSTAISALSPDEAAVLVQSLQGIEAHLLLPDGRRRVLRG